MPRPIKCRRIGFMPDITYFKPAGVPLRMLEEIILSFDELEALRLKDIEGLEQQDGADQMGVSRATFRRVLVSARRKVADALVGGKALRVEGGAVVHEGSRGGPADGRGVDGPRDRGHPHGRGRRPAGGRTLRPRGAAVSRLRSPPFPK